MTITNNHNADPVELSREGQYLIDSWEQFTKQAKVYEKEETVKVSETFGFVAYLYEKLRTSVEYKGEHVLRRAAIERILHRIISLDKSAEDKAEIIVNEMTWSRFLNNDSIPRSKLASISQILDKYDYLLNSSALIESGTEDFDIWLIGVASTEIEELISPSFIRVYLSPLMFSWLKNNFELDSETLPEDDREVQLFIAAQRALAKADQPILRYRLLLLMMTQWTSSKNQDYQQLANLLPQYINEIEMRLNYPQKNLVFRFVQNYTPMFVFLNELLVTSHNPGEVLNSPVLLANAVQKVADEKYAKLRQTVNNAIIRSIIYLLVTKVLLALLIELPYELYVLKSINYLPLGVNILFPPLLMMFIGITTRLPNESNTARIIQGLKKVLYKTSDEVKLSNIKLTLNSRQKRLSRYFSAFYTLLVIGMMYLVSIFLLDILGYNPISLLLFFVFLSLVLLFGYRVRWESQELTVSKQVGGVVEHLLSIMAMPFINLGAWLSSRLSQINIFMFVLDVIIDAPLKTLIRATEEWSQFLKRKQEEMVEVPLE